MRTYLIWLNQLFKIQLQIDGHLNKFHTRTIRLSNYCERWVKNDREYKKWKWENPHVGIFQKDYVGRINIVFHDDE